MHLISVDTEQHDHGREAPQVREALALLDGVLARLSESAERAGILGRTAFVVVGDHGFVDVTAELAPNVWLVETGLRGSGADRGSWRATFHVASGSAFLHLLDPDDTAAVAEVRAALAALAPDVRDRFRIVERPELDALGVDPRVPLALAAGPGTALSPRSAGPAERPARGAKHGYLPALSPEMLTGLVAWGSGVRAGAVAREMGLEDVAPLVARLLGLDFPTPDGVLRDGLLDPGR